MWLHVKPLLAGTPLPGATRSASRCPACCCAAMAPAACTCAPAQKIARRQHVVWKGRRTHAAAAAAAAGHSRTLHAYGPLQDQQHAMKEACKEDLEPGLATLQPESGGGGDIYRRRAQPRCSGSQCKVARCVPPNPAGVGAKGGPAVLSRGAASRQSSLREADRNGKLSAREQ